MQITLKRHANERIPQIGFTLYAEIKLSPGVKRLKLRSLSRSNSKSILKINELITDYTKSSNEREKRRKQGTFTQLKNASTME